MIVFADRVDAGRRLAERLDALRGQDAVVLGLPRGGVPVAFEVATALDLPLDVIVVRKLGVPFQPELAMGAIGEGGVRFLNEDLVRRARVTAAEVARVEERERAVLDDRVARFRRGHERIDLHGRIAVIVDDGIATGATARVACEVARRLGATRVVLAVPVAAPESVREMTVADDVVALSTPAGFYAVGAHYRDFSPTTDDEVSALLDLGHRRTSEAGAGGAGAQTARGAIDEDVQIPVGRISIEGHLNLPEGANGIVVFAHGSGSSRHSPRNRYVAGVLQQAGLGTLLLDLLTAGEEHDRANVFDIELLADRLRAVTAWLGDRADTSGCRIGYFGASTGAGAALWAAGEPDAAVSAIVSRGGRPDLAAPRLAAVQAPTLLVVGSRDDVVLELNRRAQAMLEKCESELSVVAGATHLFEEPGTLAEAAILARDWFVRYLAPRARRPMDRESP